MFRFSLENVLKSRRIQEKVRQISFSEFLKKRLMIISEIERIQDEIKKTSEAMANHKLEGIFGLYEFKNLKNLTEKLSHQLALTYQSLSDFEVAFEQERQKMTDAVRKRKVMETLKEKERERYFQEVKKKEQHFFDEINITRFHFSKNSKLQKS